MINSIISEFYLIKEGSIKPINYLIINSDSQNPADFSVDKLKLMYNFTLLIKNDVYADNKSKINQKKPKRQ